MSGKAAHYKQDNNNNKLTVGHIVELQELIATTEFSICSLALQRYLIEGG